VTPSLKAALRPPARQDSPSPSECDLRDEVSRALAEFPARLWSRLDVSDREGRITLRGRVGSFHAKQLAQAVAMAVDGVERLNNEIVVESPR
jgi:osmotically-inducible protein OsmY